MDATRLEPPRVADRCPYSRDFGPDFHACVAYTQEAFTALDTGYRPLRPVLTCRHLAIGAVHNGGFYPRCALGGPQHRERWAQEVGPDRLRALRELSIEYRTWVADLMPAVWESKGRLLAARAERRDQSVAAEDLRQRVAELLVAVDDWIDKRADRLAALGLEPANLKSLVTVATQECVAHQ